MKQFFGLVLLVAVFGLTCVAQQQRGGVLGQSNGTINDMDQSPDINQRLVGQRPDSSSGGFFGGNPDNTDRVSGKAYPVAGGATGAAGASAASTKTAAGVDPNSATPMPDKATEAAAKKGISVPNNSAEAKHSPAATMNMTPSPGKEAQSRPKAGKSMANTPKRD